jgi:hypothetical protein
VIAARNRLDDGRLSFRQQSREQNTGLHLRARDGQLVVNAVQACGAHLKRREAHFAAVDARAHRPQRLGDAIDGSAADAVVAVEHPVAGALPGEPAREDAHQRARVAHLDRLAGVTRGAQADAANGHVERAGTSTLLVDVGAQRGDRVQGRLRVGGAKVALDTHR